MKQRGVFSSGEILTDSFKGVPNRDVGIGRLVDREIAFEHAATDAEFLYAKIEIRRHRICQLSGRRLDVTLVPVIAGSSRSKSA